MSCNVIIEEVTEDYPEVNETNTTKEKKRKQEMTSFEQSVKRFRRIYTQIDKRRVEKDFMYMIISGKNEEEKKTFFVDLVKTMKKTYVETERENGLTRRDIKVLEHALESNNTNALDALWFFSLYVLPSLPNWILNGDPENRKLPPPIGNKEMFSYFITRQTFSQMCDSFLDNKLNFDAFAIAMRSEYAMTVGFVSTEEYARGLINKEEMKAIELEDNNNSIPRLGL